MSQRNMEKSDFDHKTAKEGKSLPGQDVTMFLSALLVFWAVITRLCSSVSVSRVTRPFMHRHEGRWILEIKEHDLF